MSCLAEQAKILVAEAEENNLDTKVKNRVGNDGTCAVCASKDTTASLRARSGGRWKKDWARMGARRAWETVYHDANRHDDALCVKEAKMSMLRLAHTKRRARSADQSCDDVCKGWDGRTGPEYATRRILGTFEAQGPRRLHQSTLGTALNLSTSLVDKGNYAEARAFMRDQMELARAWI